MNMHIKQIQIASYDVKHLVFANIRGKWLFTAVAVQQHTLIGCRHFFFGLGMLCQGQGSIILIHAHCASWGIYVSVV